MRRTLSTAIPSEAKEDLHRLGRIVEERLGLVFSEKRSLDLWRALGALADRKEQSPTELLRCMAEKGLPDAEASTLAEHLTVGETYFFREPKTLKALEELILKRYIIEERSKRLRIWCAGCSSGEEPYTLSMILHRLIPDIHSWDVSILGTDINQIVLEKAKRGVYSTWSFRGLDDASRRFYFDPLDNGSWSVKPLFRQGVSFSPLNLTDGMWRLWIDGAAPDIIFCRNVLIYFAAKAREKVIRRFHALLPSGGWFVVAPCETSVLLESKFTPVHHDGATLYRKDALVSREELPIISSPAFFSESVLGIDVQLDEDAVFKLPEELPILIAEEFFVAEATFLPYEEAEEEHPESIAAFLQNARTLADTGQYEDALQWIVKAKELDRTAPEPLYLAALIRSETGDEREATASLRGALFLAPDFIMAHYALSSLALKGGRRDEAERHLRNAESFLSSLAPEAPLREGDGLLAGELLQIIQQLRR